MNQIFEAAGKVGWHGATGLILVVTFCGLTVYSVVADKASAEALVGALVLLIGGSAVAAKDQFGGGK